MTEKENMGQSEEEVINDDETTTSSFNEEIEKLHKQLEEAKSKYLYLYSDFDNFRRNASKERIELISTAGREIITSLIPVIDDFERAAKAGNVSEGMQLIQHKLLNTLEQKGLRVMDTEIGSVFDANFHEAIAEIPAPTPEMKGNIIDILEKGYLLGDKIIRFAKVVVGN